MEKAKVDAVPDSGQAAVTKDLNRMSPSKVLLATTTACMAIWIIFTVFYDFPKPISNGCVKTYESPTYIPVPTPKSVSSASYKLYLCHEGRKKIDFLKHHKQLSGIPVLFIHGNGGSYKQVSSLAVESERAYQAAQLERAHLGSFELPKHYVRKMDWFAVDLKGERSALDARILEEQTEYVVYAIHRILDHYKESQDARGKEDVSAPRRRNLPKSVILVGHSMGGFVARAAVIHPGLRKSTVETLLTLSSPHQSPPLPLHPSVSQYFSWVNEQWRKGYKRQTSRPGHHHDADPLLSHVIVISIFGGHNDYQVRSELESIDDIVPLDRGFMISSSRIKNVWLSMEHTAVLWCNQLVVQVSHTLLSLIEPGTRQPAPDPLKRLAIFARMLQSEMPQSINTTIEANILLEKGSTETQL